MNAFEQALKQRMGEANFAKLQTPRIGIAGIGGLGSNCAHYLVRSGFKHFTLVDFDTVDASNLNRQYYTLGQMGQDKGHALKTNLLSINPALDIQTHTLKLEPRHLTDIFATCSIIIEAFDTVPAKRMLAEAFWGSDKLLVTASGLAGWGNADAIRIHRRAKNVFLIGDLTTEISSTFPPMAPRVNVAAAKQADVVLAWVLEGAYTTPGQHATKAARLATDLYGITAEKYSLGRTNAEVVGQMLEAGIKLIQYREKDKSQKEKVAECRMLRELTRTHGATFIVNDDLAIAQMVDADGVHMGQDDLPIEEVRTLLGPEKIIGLSTHSPAQLHDAMTRGADYIGVGPLYTTQTKVNVCAAVGLEYLDYARAHATVPFVAIGGIKEHNLPDVLAHGATCVALVTEIVGAEDIAGKITSLRTHFQKPTANN